MKDKIVDVSSYGLYCLSVESFSAFLREHKIKTKKLASFFDKNRLLLEQAMQAGSLLPLSIIDSVEYVIQVSEGPTSFHDEWVEVVRLDNCNLLVGDDAAVWVGSMGTLDAWNPTDYNNQQSLSYQTMDGETLYSDYRFDVKPGSYKVTLRGFKRRQALDYPAANYGFAYELHPADNFDSFTNPLVEDVNIGDM